MFRVRHVTGSGNCGIFFSSPLSSFLLFSPSVSLVEENNAHHCEFDADGCVLGNELMELLIKLYF